MPDIKTDILNYFRQNPTEQLKPNTLAHKINVRPALVMNILPSISELTQVTDTNNVQRWTLKSNVVRQQPQRTTQQRTTTVRPTAAPVNRMQRANQPRVATPTPTPRPTATRGTTNIPNLTIPNLTRPRTGLPLDLFEYVIQYAIRHNEINNTNTHAQWATKFFGYETTGHQRQFLMSKVRNAYSIYFTNGIRYSFDIAKIVEDFPQWFGQTQNIQDPIKSLYAEIDLALGQELREARDTKNIEWYRVTDLVQLQQLPNNHYVYVATLNVEEGNEPHIREGLSFVLKIAGNRYNGCEVVEYNYENSELIFTYHSRLYFSDYASKSITIDNSFLIDKLKSRLLELAKQDIDPDYPIYKFVMGQTEKLRIHNIPSPPAFIGADLDESQKKAYYNALYKDITFIWGPPGTGKSFTLASIIRALYNLENERTAVCCISNVAVDQLLNKVVDVLEKEKLSVRPGNFYRAGHSTDERILATDFLFPEDDRTRMLRANIKELKNELSDLVRIKASKERIIEKKALIKDTRIKLQDHTNHLVSSSRVVFSTVSNFVGSERINQAQFDNLIVDEASMLAMPQLLAIANKVAKRIILVGDFQQLSPIALAPHRRLRQNVFAMCGISIDDTEHPALHQLLNQRRSYTDIVKLINQPFYRNRLVSKVTDVDKCANVGPLAGRSISQIKVPNGAVRFTRGGTRQNKQNAEYVVSLLDKYYAAGDYSFTIGVITPYKGQASLLRALVHERNYPAAFVQNIKIGTVHTFQGSECDVIIFDVVDTTVKEDGGSVSVGKIYSGQEGEQLVNVAVSRARHKLIVVGDTQHFLFATGNAMESKTLNILNKLGNYPANYTP